MLKFLTFLATLGRAEEKCPDKWTKYNGHCYMIGNVLGEETKGLSQKIKNNLQKFFRKFFRPNFDPFSKHELGIRQKLHVSCTARI